MSRVLRTVIACLLLVALPLQGYAAGAMLFCGAGDAHTSVLAHHHDDSTEHERDGAHDHDAGAGAHAAGDPTPHDPMHGTCSACASCCSAAALPSTPMPSAAAAPQGNAFPAFEHASTGHGPALLERPPRQVLA